MSTIITEEPQLKLSDAEIEFNIGILTLKRDIHVEVIENLVPGREASREEYMFHISEGSNAWAMGDKKMWAYHKKCREPIQQTYFDPIAKEKDLLAAVIEEINPLADEVLRRQGKYLTYQGDTLGTAVKTTSFPPQSAEWHEQRAKGVGGSDIAAIMNVSPWLDRDELFLYKTGQKVAKPATSGAGALWRGTIWEDDIARQYLHRHESESQFVNCKDSWKSASNDYQTANLDGLIFGLDSETPEGIVEIKTSSMPESWVDGVPVYYRLQTLWYMDAFDLGYARVAVLIDDYDYHEFTVIPEPGELENIHREVSQFVDEVHRFTGK